MIHIQSQEISTLYYLVLCITIYILLYIYISLLLLLCYMDGDKAAKATVILYVGGVSAHAIFLKMISALYVKCSLLVQWHEA